MRQPTTARYRFLSALYLVNFNGEVEFFNTFLWFYIIRRYHSSWPPPSCPKILKTRGGSARNLEYFLWRAIWNLWRAKRVKRRRAPDFGHFMMSSEENWRQFDRSQNKIDVNLGGNLDQRGKAPSWGNNWRQFGGNLDHPRSSWAHLVKIRGGQLEWYLLIAVATYVIWSSKYCLSYAYVPQGLWAQNDSNCRIAVHKA